MPRRPRSSTGGYVFHVLNRAVARQKLFHTEGDYFAFQKLLDEAQQHTPMRLLAFTIMPNHWHLVLWPQGDGDLSEYMRWLTGTHSQRWHAFHGTAGTGALYQGRFKSFPVEKDDHFFQVCRYVERNALRVNLVSRAEMWRWSSLWQWHNDRADTRLCAWPLPRPSRWPEVVNRPETDAELAALRACVNRGTPFGSSDWRRQTVQRLGLEKTLAARGRPKKST